MPGSSVYGIVQARILEGRHKSQRIKVQQEVYVYLKADSRISNSRHSKCTHGKGVVWTGKARLAVSFGWTRKSWAGRGGKEVGVDGTVCGEGF